VLRTTSPVPLFFFLLQAFLECRGYVTPQYVKSIGYDVLRHRVSVTYEAEAEDLSSDHLLKRIFDHLKVP
jgi:MoxR-like ATPase